MREKGWLLEANDHDCKNYKFSIIASETWKKLRVHASHWFYVEGLYVVFAENRNLPAIACKAPPRTPPVKRPAMAPTGAVEAMESLVFGFVTIDGISFRLLSTTVGKFNVFSLKVDGFVCRKRLLCEVEKESTS